MSNAHSLRPRDGQGASRLSWARPVSEPPAQPSPWAKGLGPVIWILCAMALLAWLRFGLELWQTTLLDTSPPQGVHTIAIGAHTLSVPAAMLAPPDAGERAPTRLVLAWPSLEGAAAEARLPEDDAKAPLIHATLSPARDSVAPAGLLQRVYAPNFTGTARDAPQGLTGRLLAPGSGYGGETLYFEPAAMNEDDAFAIRCSPAGADGRPASMCLRRMGLGDMQVDYRYRHDMLGEWRAIETGLRALLMELEGG